jgi:hypothetical protein
VFKFFSHATRCVIKSNDEEKHYQFEKGSQSMVCTSEEKISTYNNKYLRYHNYDIGDYT